MCTTLPDLRKKCDMTLLVLQQLVLERFANFHDQVPISTGILKNFPFSRLLSRSEESVAHILHVPLDITKYTICPSCEMPNFLHKIGANAQTMKEIGGASRDALENRKSVVATSDVFVRMAAPHVYRFKRMDLKVAINS